MLRAEEHPTPAQAAGSFELLAEGSEEDPLERLRVVLRHLDEENAVLPTSVLHKAVREAEDLAQLTGSRFLPPQVSQRLNHWRTVLRQRFEVPTPDSPPREVFDRLADEFRAVHVAGDRHWPSVSAVRWAASTHCASHPRTSADESLKALRRLLHDLGSRRVRVTTAATRCHSR
ncbi:MULTISPECIES: hypothetical protein [Streptomyces]|uniref:hypothetical protein n=1 Tax=Streptomyces TaxID=1883 RepID=UPI0036C6F9EE